MAGFTPGIELLAVGRVWVVCNTRSPLDSFSSKMNKQKLHGTSAENAVRAWRKHSPFLVTHSCLCRALVLSPSSAPRSLILFCVFRVTSPGTRHATPQLRTQAVPNFPAALSASPPCSQHRTTQRWAPEAHPPGCCFQNRYKI